MFQLMCQKSNPLVNMKGKSRLPLPELKHSNNLILISSVVGCKILRFSFCYLLFTFLRYHRSTAQCLNKAERNLLYQELRSCLDFVEPIDGKPLEEVVGFMIMLSVEINNLEIVLTFLQAANRLISYQFLGREGEMCIFFFDQSASNAVIFRSLSR